MRVLYQAPVSWDWIRQRPHFMAEGLARSGHDVLWLYAANLFRGRLVNRRIGNLHILEVPILPFASRIPLFAWLNRLWISLWCRRGRSFDIAVLTAPLALPSLPQTVLELPVVYDCMDIQSSFHDGWKKERTLRAERLLTSRSRRIVASSESIRDFLIRQFRLPEDRMAVISNGIDIAVGARGKAVQVVRPSVAYFGTISSWLDWDSIIIAARENEAVSFDLFGPAECGLPDGFPGNVHVHAPLSHDDAIAQMRCSDVLMMPFLRNELTEGVDPVKMYEYLQAEKPIVSSWWPLLDKFKEFPAVRFYDAAHGFSSCIRSAIAGPKTFARPVDFLARNDWRVKVGEFSKVLKSAGLRARRVAVRGVF